MSVFADNYRRINLFATNEAGNGLYSNQIGAVCAVLGHFTVRKDPALVAMPTGTGKTAVMILLSYLLKARKVLVLTPSVLVREQIANHFRNPALLIEYGILHNHLALPSVYELGGVEENPDRWQQIIRAHDVVVGIPGTINKINDLKALIGEDNIFDLVFVDEAHHSRAASWTNVLHTFNDAKQVLLTATPFRTDNRDIKARIVYHFPLKQAYEQGLFSQIQFVSVEVNNTADDIQKNISIARQAEQVFAQRADESHRIIIRTDSKAAANNLYKIYRENTELHLAVVHSNLTDQSIRKRVQQLREGTLDGIICVDMMGEGFDFPSLKIAAVHIPHKSLAITLQFIGRISRTNTANGNRATVVAVENALRYDAVQLYKKESKDWSLILPDLHLARVQRKEEEQEFFDSFESETDSEVSDGITENVTNIAEISNDDFFPFFHVRIYRLSTITQLASGLTQVQRAAMVNMHSAVDFDETGILVSPEIRHHHVSDEHATAVFVVNERRKPDWYLVPGVVFDVTHQLFVMYFDVTTGLFFICATKKESELYNSIIKQYLAPNVRADMVLLPHLKRLMADWEDPRMFNIGLKNRKTKGNSESYKQLLGSKAEVHVSQADILAYTRGHSFGAGFDRVLNKEVLLGICTASKVWTLEENKIIYLVRWCRELALKIEDPQMDDRETPLSDLDTGTIIESFPQGEIFLADWHESWYEKLAQIAFVDNDGTIIEEALSCTCTIAIEQRDTEVITLTFNKNGAVARLEYRIHPRVEFVYTADTPTKICLKVVGNPVGPEKILSQLVDYPIHLYYEDLSMLAGKVYFAPRDTVRTFPGQHLLSHVWPDDVDVTQEYYTTPVDPDTPRQRSIHEYLIDLARNEFDVVFYDHASLEIADVIGLRSGCIHFYHCKKQDSPEPRCRVDDIYEVNGQAAKSVHWANRKRMLRQMVERADKNGIGAKLRKGTIDDIERILNEFDNPVIPVEIYIVQPGLKLSDRNPQQDEAFERILRLFSSTDTYIREVSSCQLFVMGT